MSVSHTTEQVYNRTKTVTRRKGWWEDKNGRRILKPGDRLTLCEKVMGRRKGEPLVRIVDVEAIDVQREHLWEIEEHPGDVQAEGFAGKSTEWFIRFFCDTFGGERRQWVTRIEWRYLDAPSVAEIERRTP